MLVVMTLISMLTSTSVNAILCTDAFGEEYTIEPGNTNSIFINDVEFKEIKVDEYKDTNTTIHATWFGDENGVIALLSVLSTNHGKDARIKLHLIKGEKLQIGECKV